jgi:hypothetical protein
MAVSVKYMIQDLPAWLYALRFNYVKFDGDQWIYSNEVTKASDKYTFFNRRHRVSGQLMVNSARDASGNLVSVENNSGLPPYSGTLILTPWSWDEYENNTAENRLGLVRPGVFSFSDYMKAEIQLKFALGEYAEPVPGSDPLSYVLKTGLLIYETQEKHFYYDTYGRLQYVLELKRAPEDAQITNIDGSTTEAPITTSIDSLFSYILSQANPRIITDTNQVYANTTVTTAYSGISASAFQPPAYQANRHAYKELSAEIHTIYSEETALNPAGDLLSWEDSSELVLAPIPRITRIASLDPGRWQPTSLDDSAAAIAARYNGWIYNNAYYNLNLPADVGLQQIIGHADADFVYFWERQYSSNFGDIRSIRSALMSYINYLAALVCRELRIRLVYMTYVGELITYYEALRGSMTVPNPTQYGVHAAYPFASAVQFSYDRHIATVLDLARLDLGANDAGGTLAAEYKKHYAAYNKFMSGDATAGPEVAKLGASAAARLGQSLKTHFDFNNRILTANIDRALTDAFMRDVSLAGSVSVNDPAITINPGDSVTLNFLDETMIALKAMGSSIEVSPESISYSVNVKRPLL